MPTSTLITDLRSSGCPKSSQVSSNRRLPNGPPHQRIARSVESVSPRVDRRSELALLLAPVREKPPGETTLRVPAHCDCSRRRRPPIVLARSSGPLGIRRVEILPPVVARLPAVRVPSGAELFSRFRAPTHRHAYRLGTSLHREDCRARPSGKRRQFRLIHPIRHPADPLFVRSVKMARYMRANEAWHGGVTRRRFEPGRAWALARSSRTGCPRYRRCGQTRRHPGVQLRIN